MMSLMELLIIVSSDFINKSNDNIIDTLNNMIERLNQIKFDKIYIVNHKVNLGCDFLFEDIIIILSIINPMITGKVLIVSEMNNIKNEIEVNNVECDFYCIDNNKFGYRKNIFYLFFMI